MKKDQLQKLYQTYRLYIFPSVVALSSLILIIFVIYPQAVKLISSNSVKESLLVRTKLLEVKAQTVESYDEGDLSQKLNYALSSYPTEKDFVSAIASLQLIIAKSGFEAVSIGLGSSASAEGSQSFSIKLELTGPQIFLANLLKGIESSSRLMKVSSVEISAGRDPQGVAVSLSVDVLYSTAPQIPSVDSPVAELSAQEQEVIQKIADISPAREVPSGQATTFLGPRGKENPFE